MERINGIKGAGISNVEMQEKSTAANKSAKKPSIFCSQKGCNETVVHRHFDPNAKQAQPKTNTVPRSKKSAQKQEPKPLDGPTSTYNVQKGDTLWGIARGLVGEKATNKEVADMVKVITQANGIDPNKINKGQNLTLPKLGVASGGVLTRGQVLESDKKAAMESKPAAQQSQLPISPAVMEPQEASVNQEKAVFVPKPVFAGDYMPQQQEAAPVVDKAQPEQVENITSTQPVTMASTPTVEARVDKSEATANKAEATANKAEATAPKTTSPAPQEQESKNWFGKLVDGIKNAPWNDILGGWHKVETNKPWAERLGG